MANNSPKEILGLDVGQAHIGVARASTAAGLAEPLATVDTDKALDQLADFIKDRAVESVVVGLPRGLDGNETAQTAWTRQWLEQAKKQLKVAFFWQDEALTNQYTIDNKQYAKSQEDEHATAAARILQDFLDSPEADRHPG